MRLFKEMEKTFPTMEKVYRNLLAARYDGLNEQEKYHRVKEAMISCAIFCYLDDGSRLYQLFVQAGITDKNEMAHHLIEWMLINMRFNENRFSRAGTSPARE